MSEDFFLESADERDELGRRKTITSKDAPWMDNLSDALDYASGFRDSFCQAAEEILCQNPLDIFARQATLDYLDTITRTEEWIGIPEDIEIAKEDAGELIGHILQLAPIEDITDWPNIAWEARQAARFSKWDRAKGLLEHALNAKLALRADILLLRAGHLFLSVYRRSIPDCAFKEGMETFGNLIVCSPSWAPLAGQSFWHELSLEVGTALLCVEAAKLRTDLADQEREHLCNAVGDIQNSNDTLKGRWEIFQLILPACLYSLGRYSEAIRAYERSFPMMAKEKQKATCSILRSIALCYESDGDLQEADSALQKAQELFPNEKGIRKRRSELFQRKADMERAYELLREETEIDPSLGEQQIVSLALSLGEMGSAIGAAEKAAIQFLEKNKDTGALMESMLQELWPAFDLLCDEAKNEIVLAVFFHHRPDFLGPRLHEAHLAAACTHYGTAVEIELRRDIFIAFREQNIPVGKKIIRTPESDKSPAIKSFNKSILSPVAPFEITLGQMNFILRECGAGRNLEKHAFSIWIRRKNSTILTKTIEIGKLADIRNKQTHKDSRFRAQEQVSVISSYCRIVLDALKENPKGGIKGAAAQ